MRSHEWIDQRSLALDRLIADKLAARPELFQRAVLTLDRWIEVRQPNPPAMLLEWRRILRDHPLAEVLALLRSDTEPARRGERSMFHAVIEAVRVEKLWRRMAAPSVRRQRPPVSRL